VRVTSHFGVAAHKLNFTGCACAVTRAEPIPMLGWKIGRDAVEYAKGLKLLR
jgi:hypothetical protein